MIDVVSTKHHVCFPTKLLAGNGGKHIYNIVLSADVDNGTICSRGAYVSFDQYNFAAAPANYAAVIREKAANGNWYVEVTALGASAPILIAEVEDNPNTDARLSGADKFYNASGEVVRGYELEVGDMYELSSDAFQGTPVAGAVLTISGQKHVVGAVPSV